MTIRKVLSILLVLLMVLPMMASAETGSLTFKLFDPTLKMEDADMNFEGIALQIGGAWDTDAAKAALNLVLLAQDAAAISAVAGLDGENLYALVNGLSSVLTLPASEIENVGAMAMESLPEEVAGPLSGIMSGDTSAFMPDIEGILSDVQIQDAGMQMVDFGAGEVEAEVVTAHISNEQLKAIGGDALSEIPEGATVDMTIATSDADLKISGTINGILEDADNPNLDFVALINIAEDGIKLDAQLGQDETTMLLDIFFAMGENGANPKFVFDFAAVDGGNTVAAVTMNYDGTVEQADDGMKCAGTFGIIAASSGSELLNASIKIELIQSDDVEGKLPDISGMNQVNVMELTEEQMEQFTGELQELLMTVVGQMMTVPSVAELISGMM